MKVRSQMSLHPKVEEILRQKPELFGILGKSLLESIGEVKVQRLSAEVLADYPDRTKRYLVISTDRRLLCEVGSSFWQWLKQRFYYPCERVVAAIKSHNIGYAEYVVAIHEPEFPDGFDAVPRRLILYLLPAGQNMAGHLSNLEFETRKLISEDLATN
jgi:hypothetical protein